LMTRRPCIVIRDWVSRHLYAGNSKILDPLNLRIRLAPLPFLL
jgi:hypothetical protein